LRETRGQALRSGILVVVTDPGRLQHWWYSKADRARIERVSDQIDESRRRAESATDPHSQERYLRSARRLERTRRTYRTYPLSIWLWGASAIAVVLPWSILAGAGYAGIGWAVSAVVLLGVVLIRWRLQHRRQNKHPTGSLGSGEETP
jgi:Flp pilus assembly protein TadB